VRSLGGYEREYFITQTPELAAMADVVIDLDSMHVDGRGQSSANTTEDAA
jgi:exonuclease SbcC